MISTCQQIYPKSYISDSTGLSQHVKKRLFKCGLIANRKPLLRFAKLHLSKDLRNNVLQTNKTKVEIWTIMHSITCSINQIQQISTNPSYQMCTTESSGGGEVMIWTCFAAIAPGYLSVVGSTMNSVYRSILESNVKPFV